MNPTPLTHLRSLSREEIHHQSPGRWDDYDLLDLAQHFLETEDRDREAAVYELILRSPQVSELVDYGAIYEQVVGYYQEIGDYSTALGWAYAWIGFDERHEAGANRELSCIQLADIYLQAGDLEPAITLYTHRLQLAPDELWLHLHLGELFLDVGLYGLAAAVLAEGLSKINPETAAIWQEELSALHQQSTSETGSLLESWTSLDPQVLAEFQAALSAPGGSGREPDESEPYPPAVLGLTGGLPEDQEDLFAEILSIGPAAIPALIRLAFDQELALSSGPEQAIALLRRLQPDYLAEYALLADWLAQADGDWRRERLSHAIGKIAGYPTEELGHLAADTRLDTGVRDSALLALIERAETMPEQRGDIIERFKQLLSRPEAYEASEEQFISALINAACDLDARELYPQIRLAYEEDRVDTTIVALSDIHEEWELEPLRLPPRRTDGLYLPLKCTACSRTREHFTQYVLVDVDTLDRDQAGEPIAHDPHILDHAIQCPKCQSIDRYEVTPLGLARIIGPDLFEAFALEKSGKKGPKIKPNPRVLFFRSAVLGKPMHPLAGLDEYQRRLSRRPDDPYLYLGVGTLLRTILRYPEALGAHRKALAIAPDEPEVLLTCALSEHDLGDSEKARGLYQQLIDLDRSPEARENRLPDELMVTAINGLHQLDQGNPSPWESQFQDQMGNPVPHPSLNFKLHPAHKKKTKRGRRRKR